jgi:hypothetical protein
MVGTPAFGGQVTSIYASSVLKLQNAFYSGKEADFNVAVQWGDALIPRARQDIVTRFLEMPEATHLLMVDADIGFEPEQVFRLLRFDAEITAGVYPYKRLNIAKLKALALAGNGEMEPASLSYVFEVDDPNQVVLKNGFAKVRYAGAGFMLVKRSALMAMIKRYPELNYSAGFIMGDALAPSRFRYALFNSILDPQIGTYLSEDYSFCRRWTDMGGEIWADLESRLQHVGPIVFQGDFQTQFKGNHPG